MFVYKSIECWLAVWFDNAFSVLPVYMGIPYLKTGAPWSLDLFRYKKRVRDQIQLPFCL